MKKIILILTMLFFKSLVYSQVIEEIEKENIIITKTIDSLSKIRNEIETKIFALEEKIKTNNYKLKILTLKESSIKVLVRKNCSFFESPNNYSKILDYPNKKEEIFLIEYHIVGNYYKAIFNDKIGYINEKEIIPTKSSKKLKKTNLVTSKNKLNLLSPLSSNSNYKVNKTSSRTYYRGTRGGCYYINRNGNKTYVDRSLCN